MAGFKVGDVVAGLPHNSYGITSIDMKAGVVIECDDYKMRVRILEHLIENTHDHRYRVDNSPRKFKLVGRISGDSRFLSEEKREVLLRLLNAASSFHSDILF